ncbi:mitochondrial carrier domain-containing protein [Vararia minispora EC-137]|uniref:Mitochondrial carrier domain-containing protein n=1 Tax=Vararia minispora EC-137 TaxID=1314806 RepID=A0ACB8QET1_9AGAM|nr:mitochondrial carrier domain-containing protein [Vararia minispora EC-137]
MSAKTDAVAAVPSAPPVQTPKKEPYPFWVGGVAATIAASITHPLDLTKVRLQASGDKGMVKSMVKTVRTAGVLGLYDGLTGTWLRQMTYSICRFWAYDESRKIIGATEKDAPLWKLITAGSMAGAIAGLVGNPGEAIMVRMQADKAKPPEKQLKYRNSLVGVYRMVREEGASALMRGAGPNVVRAILMNASQLASYDYFKAELLKSGYFVDNELCYFTASFMAGTVATTVCSPADVIKSRIMSASGPGSGSALTAIRTAMQSEGPAFMFKGWVPAWTRLNPTTILIFLTLEQLKKGIDYYRENYRDQK